MAPPPPYSASVCSAVSLFSLIWPCSPPQPGLPFGAPFGPKILGNTPGSVQGGARSRRKQTFRRKFFYVRKVLSLICPNMLFSIFKKNFFLILKTILARTFFTFCKSDHKKSRRKSFFRAAKSAYLKRSKRALSTHKKIIIFHKNFAEIQPQSGPTEG